MRNNRLALGGETLGWAPPPLPPLLLCMLLLGTLACGLFHLGLILSFFGHFLRGSCLSVLEVKLLEERSACLRLTLEADFVLSRLLLVLCFVWRGKLGPSGRCRSEIELHFVNENRVRILSGTNFWKSTAALAACRVGERGDALLESIVVCFEDGVPVNVDEACFALALTASGHLANAAATE